MPTKKKLTEQLIGMVCALITIIIICIPVAAQSADAGSGSGAGLTSGIIDITTRQTARLAVRNAGDKGVAVRLQFVDQQGKVLIQRDVTIEAGADEALNFSFTEPNNSLGVASSSQMNPKGSHRAEFPSQPFTFIRAQFATKEAKSIDLLRPTLHIRRLYALPSDRAR